VRDLRLAARRLIAAPVFTVFAVLSLAIGIGLTTAVYSVIDSLFLKDLGIREPDQVVFVVTPFDGRVLSGSISRPDFEDLRTAQTSFSSVSASVSWIPSVAASSTPVKLSAEAVDGAYFSTLGVAMTKGRPIQNADETSAAHVAVVSYRLWRSRLGSDSTIVGQTIRISGQPFEIIGVAAPPFDGAAGGLFSTSVWIPLGVEQSLAASLPSDPQPPPARDLRRLRVFGRLKSTITVSAASAELAAIAGGLDASFPPRTAGAVVVATERPWRGKTIAAITEDDNFIHRFGVMLVVLVALVLVVACTNLANLVLARGTARQQDLTVRWALGASRWRLVREQGAESLLIAGAGAVAAYLVFQALGVVMTTEISMTLPMGGSWTMAIQPVLDAKALWMAAGLLLVSLAVFGLEPAIQLTRSQDIRGELAAGGGGAANPRARRQGILLRWQVAVSAGFFVIASMFVKFTIAEVRHDSGVEMERLGVAVVNLRTGRWNEAAARRLIDRVLEESRREQAVEAVSVSTGMPFGTSAIRLSLAHTTQPGFTTPDYFNAAGIAATPSIFRTIGVKILRGRGFDERDHAGATPVVVISEFTARMFFGANDVVGRQLLVQSGGSGRSIATVIGIAANTDVRMVMNDPRPFVYLPLTQRYEPYLTVVVRSTQGSAQAVGALRETLRRADPDLAVDAIGTGRTVLAGPFQLLRAVGISTVALGAVTLVLAMAGLFGIQSHLVARRTREIGLRMSFGATASQIQRMVLRDGYRPVFDGLALGLFGGLAGRVVARAYMDIDVNVIDPWMVVIVPIPVLLAAFCACYLPAHRAAAVDPNVALRHL
jgi:predicted permease